MTESLKAMPSVFSQHSLQSSTASEVQLESRIPLSFSLLALPGQPDMYSGLLFFVLAFTIVVSVRCAGKLQDSAVFARHVVLPYKSAEDIDRNPGKRQSILYTDCSLRNSGAAVPLIPFLFVEARLAERWYSHGAAEAEAADNSESKSDAMATRNSWM